MAYSKEIHKKALSILAERRQFAFEKSFRLQLNLKNQYPELKLIRQKRDALGASLTKKTLFDPFSIEQFEEKMRDLQKQENVFLNKIGYQSSDLEPPFQCKECEDTGFLNGVYCNCHEQLLKELSIEEINQLSLLKLSSFQDFSVEYYSTKRISETGVVPREEMQFIYQFCLDYAQNFRIEAKNILMIGSPGLGKTHLSLSIAKEVIAKGYAVIYGSFPNLVTKLEKERFKDSNDDSLNQLLTADLLVLDDLGTEFPTQFTTSITYNLLNTRINTSKPTIINTNLSLQDLQKMYSSRILSRILGSYEILNFIGEDIRLKKGGLL